MNQTTQHVILGTGQLGLAIMDELVAQGHPVKLANRRGRIAEPLPANVVVTAADATDIDLPHTLTYIRDFARALVTLGEHEEAYGRAWHVPSAETITPRQFVSLIEEEIGQPVPTRSAGKNMIRLIGLFNPNVHEIVEIMYEFEEPFVVDHSRYVAAFSNGVTPHKQAIKETVAWYRETDLQVEACIALPQPYTTPADSTSELSFRSRAPAA